MPRAKTSVGALSISDLSPVNVLSRKASVVYGLIFLDKT